jgi:hypothetical protein
VNLALQDPATAEQRFRQALHLATELRWPAPTLSALMGFALLYRSDASRSAPLADLVYRHPATEHVHREMARDLLNALGAPLPDTRDATGLSQAIAALLAPQAP